MSQNVRERVSREESPCRFSAARSDHPRVCSEWRVVRPELWTATATWLETRWSEGCEDGTKASELPDSCARMVAAGVAVHCAGEPERSVRPNSRIKMRAFDHEPADWRELQDRVAQLFSEIGCDVTVGEKVTLVRGEKEIDVSVRDRLTTPASVYLCECKFWSRPVPQEVIHSFRTVLSDFGAHRGFIISRAGFQVGAKQAVVRTNLDLLTFEEFQSLFFDRWRIAMGKTYRPYADRLFPYWDYPGRMPRIKWEKWHIDRQQLLVEVYRPLLQIGPLFEMEGSVWRLPITLPSLDEEGNEDGTITLATYRQVYNFIDRHKEVALKRFQVLYGELDAQQ
jgi:hypothetical protein